MKNKKIKKNLKAIEALQAEIVRLKEENKKLSEQENVWPKLVRISVSKGKWSEEVVEALAEIGWEPCDNSNIGPCSNGKYICAQAWLIYKAHEDGKLELVGAEDQDFGHVGILPIRTD